MSISGIVNASNATSPGGGAPAQGVNATKSTDESIGELSKNFDTFLTLLTQQLKNQDPLQPQDTAQFTSQLVQFSQVEQAISSNKKLDSLISSINNGQTNQSIAYIGKTVEIQSNGLPLQDGKAQVTVNTDVSAVDSVLEISNPSSGRVIRAIPLNREAGSQNVVWDGQDNAGAPVNDGTYKINVRAVGPDGKDITGQTFVFGRVTGVDLTGTEPQLTIGDLPINLTSVLSVR
jgi:flagellar basal-body rod modification protein FlgD